MHDDSAAEPWALVHPDGHVAIHNLPAGGPRPRDVQLYVDAVRVPVAHARTLENDAVTFAASDGVEWTAFHSDAQHAGMAQLPDAPPGWPAGLYFNADGRTGVFYPCERPGATRRPGARLRDQITDDELRGALALARPRRRDDA